MRVSSICHIIILSCKCQLFFLQRLSITQYTAFKTGALKTGDVATCEKLMNLNSPRYRKTYSKFPDRVYCLHCNQVLGQNEKTLIYSDKRKRF